MKKIEINTSELKFHCLVCGAQNVGEEGLKDTCDHLVYLGTNEGGSEYDKLKLHNDDNEENDPDEVIEIIEEGVRDVEISLLRINESFKRIQNLKKKINLIN